MTRYERGKKDASNGSFAKYVERKAMYHRTTFRIREDGSTVYLFKGQELSPNEFKALFPIGLINRSRHPRLDSRQNIY